MSVTGGNRKLRELSELHAGLYPVVVKLFEAGCSVSAIATTHKIAIQTVERLIRRALLVRSRMSPDA